MWKLCLKQILFGHFWTGLDQAEVRHDIRSHPFFDYVHEPNGPHIAPIQPQYGPVTQVAHIRPQFDPLTLTRAFVLHLQLYAW